MKKFFSFIFLLVCFGFAGAQETDWEAISGLNEEFSVEVPKSFQIDGIRQRGDDKQRFYRYSSEGTYFFIVSSKNKEKSPYKAIELFSKTRNAETAGITIDDFSGEKIIFSEAEGFYHTIVAIKGDSHFYIFHSVSGMQNDANAARFIKSIRFKTTSPSKENQPLPTPNKTEAPKTEDEKPPTKTVSNETRGAGSGSGSGSSNVKPPILPTKPSSNQTSPVKILYAPQARYTDLARIYDIQGGVTLKITFRADGTLGAISPVSRLPFGLTANAIDAAGKITFQPAMKNGVAITVAKSVKYSFTIY